MFKEGKKVKIKLGVASHLGKKVKVVKIDKDPVNGRNRLLLEGEGLKGAARILSNGKVELIPNCRYVYEDMIEEVE